MQRVFMFVLAASAAGCTADSGNQSFLVRQNLLPTGADVCDFDTNISAPFLPRGQLFLDAPVPYVMNPLIESRVTSAPDKESLRTILLKGARVDLTIGPVESIDAAGNVTTDANEDLLQFESLFSAALPPNGGLTFASFDLVPLSALSTVRARGGGAARVHAQVTGTMRLFGDFYGEEIESEPFTYPVTVCNDCVVQGGPVFPMCPLPMTAVIREGNPCNPFQDGIVDCCESGAGILCPATKL